MSSSVTSNPASEAAVRRSIVRRRTVIRPPNVSQLNILSNLAKLAHYKDLLYTLSVHRVKVRYKQSVLGIAWAVLQPLALMLIYTVIFSLIARMPSDGAPYAIFAYVALLPWTYFSTTLTNATNSLVSHSSLVSKVYFPREILPLTYVVAAFFDLLIASTVLAGLLIYYRVSLTINALYVVPIILTQTVFMTAMALLFSATQVRFRDIGVGMSLLLQLWMFATPVVYPLSAVPERVRAFYMLNPMVGLVENFRRVVLQGAAPDFRMLGISALISFILLPATYIYFKRVEATVADII
jgi:lipopolysaccharide transport system permease protein